MGAEDTVCVAGLGGIGGAMASRLRERGWKVVGLDPDGGRRVEWSTQNDSLAEPWPDALDWSLISHLVVAVRTEEQVQAVLLACSELAGPHLRVLVVSTVHVSFWGRYRELIPASWGVVECPVSGGEGPARRGTIAMFAAGERLEADREILDDLSDHIATFAHHGAPALMKLLNNTLAAVNSANVARCLELAVDQGIDAETFLSSLDKGSGRSHVSRHLAMLSRNQFDLLEKDVQLLREDFPGMRVGEDIAELADLVHSSLGQLARPDAVL